MLFTSSLPIGAWYFSVAAQSKMRKSSSPMIPLIARVAKMLLQSRKCNSASYSDWVIATPPTGTTVYCRIRDSQWQSRRVIRKLSFTKFPHKSKACGRYRKASAIADGCFMQVGLSSGEPILYLKVTWNYLKVFCFILDGKRYRESVLSVLIVPAHQNRTHKIMHHAFKTWCIVSMSGRFASKVRTSKRVSLFFVFSVSFVV